MKQEYFRYLGPYVMGNFEPYVVDKTEIICPNKECYRHFQALFKVRYISLYKEFELYKKQKGKCSTCGSEEIDFNYQQPGHKLETLKLLMKKFGLSYPPSGLDHQFLIEVSCSLTENKYLPPNYHLWIPSEYDEVNQKYTLPNLKNLSSLTVVEDFNQKKLDLYVFKQEFNNELLELEENYSKKNVSYHFGLIIFHHPISEIYTML